MDVLGQIEELSDKLERAKQEKARAEGQLESIKERLKNEFGITDIQEVGPLIQKIEEDIEKKERFLEMGLKQLKDKYNWEE